VPATPHLDKLNASLANPKCESDWPLLEEAREHYDQWIADMENLTTEGEERVREMVGLLNRYKHEFEVEMVTKRGSAFLRRQKGQLKLDNSILEEFLIHLVSPAIVKGVGETELAVGPQNAFMSLSFRPRQLGSLASRPEVVLKTKYQDFVIGSQMHYKFSPDAQFESQRTAGGSFVLAVLAAEIKVNLDKTMFQEAAGTASRLKSGCPVAKYFVLVEYLDMQPEDTRLTDIDNVFLLRHAKRLPFDKRSVVEEVEKQHREFPVDAGVVWRFVEEMQAFVDSVWYDPDEALERGSFV
jgi:hypothetical protein